MPNLATPCTPCVDHITAWFETLFRQLESAHQRVLVSCQGTEDWCDAMMDVVIPQCRSRIVLSDRNLSVESVPFGKSEILLGQEAHVVIVDLFRGINPDVICIAGGLVKSPGILLLLSENPTAWAQVDDQYAIWQNQSRSENALFIDYFFEQMRQNSNVALRLLEGENLPILTPLPIGKETAITKGKTAEQLNLLQEIAGWLQHPEQRIALITANRGRGKSTGLGFVADELVNRQRLSVCVTAYSRQSAAMLLERYQAASFVSPDQLIEHPVEADVLIIDEAAMLPYPILAQLTRQFGRIIMATTTGGYEGTGGGFLLRFISRLSSEQLLRLEMRDPVRWSGNDCLEHWLDETLLLCPEAAESNSLRQALSSDSSRIFFRVLDRKQSQRDLALLLKIYRLMVSAHYRTRPSDLRALLENPDLLIVLAQLDEELLGVALLNREGGLDTKLCRDIFLGRRRPQGHLLAQILTAQAGVKNFAEFRGLRIQRIAVQEPWRRRGIGRRLISMADDYAREHGYDYLGASFAFDSQSSEFWRSTGFRLVHIGFGQGKSSGNHSVAVLRVLNPQLDEIARSLMNRIQCGLPLWLCQFLQGMDVESVVALVRYCQYSAQLSELELDEIEAFTEGHKGLELCFVSLQHFVMQSIAALPEGNTVHPWLIQKIVQNYDWKKLSSGTEKGGRKSIQNELRKLVKQL
ncbi:MAG: GNAT family N-acetyltransferase [Gammaproteobacteria bacterium]|nr:GNAT family N-acetyltransferase [Gammaproteobacteria bacterium]